MNLPELTAENIATAIGVGGATLWIAVKAYLGKLQAEPPPKASDVIVSGGTIADMGPFRKIDTNTERMAAAMESLATSIDVLRELLVDKQKDADREEEIMRRAEMMAQRMLQELRPPRASRQRKTAPS